MIAYVSGGRYHAGPDIIDLPYDVAPGGKLDLKITFTAPNSPGSYVSNWMIEEGSTVLCRFYILFRTH